MRQLPDGYQKGFNEPDGTLEDFVEWGFQMTFLYGEREYRTDASPDGNWAVYDVETNEIVAEAPSDGTKDFLETEFLGKPLGQVLKKEAYILTLG